MEVFRGLMRKVAEGDDRFATVADWFTSLVNGPGVEVLPFDNAAAQVAGEVAARSPSPPSGRKRGENKGTRRARWVLDIQIAATAWVHGHGVLTENVADFEAISRTMQDIYPDASPLEVVGSDP
jgi:hypothetical protein